MSDGSTAARAERLPAPLSADEERQLAQEAAKKRDDPLRVGDYWYVLSARWHRRWRRYVGWHPSEMELELGLMPADSDGESASTDGSDAGDDEDDEDDEKAVGHNIDSIPDENDDDDDDDAELQEDGFDRYDDDSDESDNNSHYQVSAGSRRARGDRGRSRGRPSAQARTPAMRGDRDSDGIHELAMSEYAADDRQRRKNRGGRVTAGRGGLRGGGESGGHSGGRRVSPLRHVMMATTAEDEEVDVTSLPRPGPIDNSELLVARSFETKEARTKPRLRDDLRLGVDILLVPQAEWQLYEKWYGGGPVIRRKVIGEGENGKYTRIEVYPMVLRVVRTNESGVAMPSTEVEVVMSKKKPLAALCKRACDMLDIDPERVRLWSSYSVTQNEPLLDLSRTLEDAKLVDLQRILIEVQGDDGHWPRGGNAKLGPQTRAMEKRAGSSGGFFSFLWGGGSSTSVDETALPGLCGLNNLGNTCFMNSALQCLSNTPPLADYFVSGRWKREVNTRNPLGMKGKLAEDFGALLKSLWAGGNASVAPKNLKWTIGKFAPQFGGFNQHDSQELLAFLLDGLHEDLNRVINKPYVEVKESDGRPDAVVAEESWRFHLARNQSVIVDLFQGQLKSTLNCPDCNKISITFDPFMYLSVPLGIDGERGVGAVLRSLEPGLPVKFTVKVSKRGKLGDVTLALSQLCGVPVERLRPADVHAHRIYQWLPEAKSVLSFRPEDVTVFFELPEGYSEDGSLIQFQALSRTPNTHPESSEFYKSSPIRVFGCPFLVFLPRNATHDQLYAAVWRNVRPYIKKPTTGTNELGSSPAATAPPRRRSTRGKMSGGASAESSSVPERYPFKLTWITQHGTSCAKCGPAARCVGCPLERSSVQTFEEEIKGRDAAIGIDWETEALEEQYNEQQANNVRVHDSTTKFRQERKQLGDLTLNECIRIFLTNERLGPQDPWYCPVCAKFVQAWKKFDLWRLPEMLVVHLKRFQFRGFLGDKITTPVGFPLEGLDLTEWVSGPQERPPIYDLFAVSNHLGGLGGGHYTAYAKNKGDGLWYHFNDSSCKPIAASSVVSPSAYVLFYMRRPASASTSAKPPPPSPARSTAAAPSATSPLIGSTSSTTSTTTTATSSSSSGRRKR